MKKIAIMVAAMAATANIYGAQLELKAGLEPWREGKNNHADFDMGGSLGAEVLFNAVEMPLDYGFGLEWKSEFKGDSGSKNSLASSEANAFPLYLTGKYGVGEDLFYLVGRAGWAMYDSSDAKDGFYGAAGVGKKFGKITMEALYESMDLGGSSKMYSGDQAGLFSVKLGYRLGENKRDRIEREAEEAARLEQERHQAEEAAKLEAQQKKAEEERIAAEMEAAKQEEMRQEMLANYDSHILPENYDTNSYEPSEATTQFFEEMASDLAEESGTLEVKGYTDNVGREAYNKSLSQKRADRAKEIIEESLNNENIEVISEGMGGTNFLNDNSTPEMRRKNRRVEVNFIPENTAK